MLCFANSKFFSLPYELQQTSQFKGNLRPACSLGFHPRVNDYIPPLKQTLLPSDTFPNVALDEIPAHRIPKSLADRDATAAVAQLIGAVEDL
jgi:hypothetical protein